MLFRCYLSITTRYFAYLQLGGFTISWLPKTELYGVEVRAINQAVKRNQTRFPKDFCFKVNSEDLKNHGSQSVIRDKVTTGNRTLPTDGTAYTHSELEDGETMVITITTKTPSETVPTGYTGAGGNFEKGLDFTISSGGSDMAKIGAEFNCTNKIGYFKMNFSEQGGGSRIFEIHFDSGNKNALLADFAMNYNGANNDDQNFVLRVATGATETGVTHAYTGPGQPNPDEVVVICVDSGTPTFGTGCSGLTLTENSIGPAIGGDWTINWTAKQTAGFDATIWNGTL